MFSNKWVYKGNEKRYASAFYRHTFDTRYASILFRIHLPYTIERERGEINAAHIFICHVPVVSIHAERKIFFGALLHFLLVGHYEHLYRVKEAQSRNRCILCNHASFNMASIPAERKIFFWPSVFFLLVCHYEHLYLVKEAQSRNKRSLCSHASCTSSMDTCREKNSFSHLGRVGGGGGFSLFNAQKHSEFKTSSLPL